MATIAQVIPVAIKKRAHSGWTISFMCVYVWIDDDAVNVDWTWAWGASSPSPGIKSAVRRPGCLSDPHSLGHSGLTIQRTWPRHWSETRDLSAIGIKGHYHADRSTGPGACISGANHDTVVAYCPVSSWAVICQYPPSRDPSGCPSDGSHAGNGTCASSCAASRAHWDHFSTIAASFRANSRKVKRQCCRSQIWWVSYGKLCCFSDLCCVLSLCRIICVWLGAVGPR